MIVIFEIQWNQLTHRPLPYSRSARVAMRAYNRCTARLIPLSWLQEWCCKRGCYVVWGGRLLSVPSRRRDLQKLTSMEVLSAFRGRGADRRWGFGASCGLKVREETGRLSPPQSVTAFRLSSLVIGQCVPDYISVSRVSRFAWNNCSLNSLHT